MTSSGVEKYHTEVSIQKTQWLCERGILYKANICPGSRLKAQYADPSIILIDDTDYVLDGFVKAGGIGILHKNVNETIQQLKLYFEEEYVLPPHTDWE